MFKYLHIMPQGSVEHNGGIINLITSSDIGFNASEHSFIIFYKDVYEEFQNYSNVFYYENLYKTNFVKFTELSEKYDLIILHSNTLSLLQLYRIPEKILNKIVWVVWGQDLYSSNNYNILNPISTLKRFVRDSIWTLKKNKIKKFKAIGVGFEYDVVRVKKLFGEKINLVQLPYGYKRNNIDELNTNILKYKENVSPINKPYKIMIGHSAFKFIKHKKIIDKLAKFKDENILISLVLSYGDERYADAIEKYALEKFQDRNKIEIIKDYLSKEEYWEYLQSVDVCILDYTHQSALGNVYLLLYFGKKLILNRNGVIKKGLDDEQIKTFTVNDLDKLDFNELVRPLSNDEICRENIVGKFYLSEKDIGNSWLVNLNELKS